MSLSGLFAVTLLPGDLEPEIEHFALAFRSEFRRHPRADLELFGCRRRVGQIKRRRAALGGRSGRRPGRLVQRARNLPPRTGIRLGQEYRRPGAESVLTARVISTMS
jgi:hypothetical protein